MDLAETAKQIEFEIDVPGFKTKELDIELQNDKLAVSGEQKESPVSEDRSLTTFQLESTAFSNNGAIPTKFTGDGVDVSPPLSWRGIPQGTLELALICDDPDAPTPQPWVHWVLYGLPPETTRLPEGLPTTAELRTPVVARQGRNSWPSGQNHGYRGPAPPKGHGVHHYHFRLFALDAPLELQPGIDKETLVAAMSGHRLGEAEWIGTFER